MWVRCLKVNFTTDNNWWTMLGVVKLLGKYLITGETKHNTLVGHTNIVLPTSSAAPGNTQRTFKGSLDLCISHWRDRFPHLLIRTPRIPVFFVVPESRFLSIYFCDMLASQETPSFVFCFPLLALNNLKNQERRRMCFGKKKKSRKERVS